VNIDSVTPSPGLVELGPTITNLIGAALVRRSEQLLLAVYIRPPSRYFESRGQRNLLAPTTASRLYYRGGVVGYIACSTRRPGKEKGSRLASQPQTAE
jgi:hypothetical protein